MTAVDDVAARSDEELVARQDRRAARPPTRRPTTGEREFLGAQFDAGLALVHFPRGLRRPRAVAPAAAVVVDRLRARGRAAPAAAATPSATAWPRRPS